VKRDIRTFLSELKSSGGPHLVLLFGDDLQVEETCKAVVDQLVPQDCRGFNLERYDGRTATWDQIEASLMTPPFFPGKKVLWVENAPYFYSREQKKELSAKVLELWRDGKHDAAARLLIDLLLVEGWTQERWERLQGIGSEPLLDLFKDEGTECVEEIATLLSYCQTRGVDFTKHQGSEDHRLGVLLDQGLPEWSVLLLSAVQVDRRSRIFKRFEAVGAAFDLTLERDRTGRVSRATLLEAIGEQLRQAGKTLDYRAQETLLTRTGDDLRSVRQELEKLLLFVGDRSMISVQDVESVIIDQGEAWIFDLTRALGDRDATAALAHLARLLAQGEAALKILATLTSETRRLLRARQLLATELAKLWRRGMTYQQFQNVALKAYGPLLTRNPYADYMCFQRAERFSLTELECYMEALFAADYRLKSGGIQPALVLERLVLGLCMRRKQAAGLAARPLYR
jgi:DNA polymerase III subunit delta